MERWVRQLLDQKTLDALPNKRETVKALIATVDFKKVEDKDTRYVLKAILYLTLKIINETPNDVFINQTADTQKVIRSLYDDLVRQGEQHQKQFERAAQFLINVKSQIGANGEAKQ
jgi:hypothetical protein